MEVRCDLHPRPQEKNLIPGFSTASQLLSKRIHFANLTSQEQEKGDSLKSVSTGFTLFLQSLFVFPEDLTVLQIKDCS